MKKLLLLISSLFISSFIVAQPCVAITGFSVTPPSCNGSMDGAILVTYTAGVAPYDIQLIGPPNQSYTTSALSQNMNGLGAGAYLVVITDNTGCQSSQPVNINQPSTLSLFTVPDPTICYGQSTQIAAAGSGGTPSYTYSWTPNTFIGGGPHTVNPTTTTSYTVSVTDANGCSPSSQVITVNVSPSLAVVGSSVYVCDGASTALVPNMVSPGNSGPYMYNWSTSETTNSIVVIGNVPSGATSTTTYTVVVDDGCTMPSATAIFTVNAVLCLGIEELNNASVSFYPNPSNGLVRIEGVEELKGIEVRDITGKIVLSETLYTKTYALNLQNVTEGIYFVKLKFSDGRTITEKIVKQ